MKSYFWWGLSFILLVGIIWYFASKPGEYDEFAKCITEEGVKMYGAYWCPHCQAQKKMFGKSWEYVEYVECATPGSNVPKEECAFAGVSSYPTWIFGDGKKIAGELTFEQLSSFSGCSLNQE